MKKRYNAEDKLTSEQVREQINEIIIWANKRIDAYARRNYSLLGRFLLEDLVQEATMKLFEWIGKNADLADRKPFIACVLKQIEYQTYNAYNTINSSGEISSATHYTASRVRKMHGDGYSAEEIMKALNIKRYTTYLQYLDYDNVRYAVSLDAPINEDGDTLLDKVASETPNEENGHYVVDEQQENQKKIDFLAKKLKENPALKNIPLGQVKFVINTSLSVENEPGFSKRSRKERILALCSKANIAKHHVLIVKREMKKLVK